MIPDFNENRLNLTDVMSQIITQIKIQEFNHFIMPKGHTDEKKN